MDAALVRMMQMERIYNLIINSGSDYLLDQIKSGRTESRSIPKLSDFFKTEGLKLDTTTFHQFRGFLYSNDYL